MSDPTTAPAAAGQTQGEAPTITTHRSRHGWRAECDGCGWLSSPPNLSREDMDDQIAYHLRAEHGEVAPPPAPEPVGERSGSPVVGWLFVKAGKRATVELAEEFAEDPRYLKHLLESRRENGWTVIPLYAAPPAAPTPTGERALREALERLIDSSVEAAFSVTKHSAEYDEYDSVVLPRWIALQSLIGHWAKPLAATPAPGGTDGR